MRHLLDNSNLICTMFLLNNPQTNTPELVIHFSNFNNEHEALDFAESFKEDTRFHEMLPNKNETIH